jgi:hypothetical protein
VRCCRLLASILHAPHSSTYRAVRCARCVYVVQVEGRFATKLWSVNKPRLTTQHHCHTSKATSAWDWYCCAMCSSNCRFLTGCLQWPFPQDQTSGVTSSYDPSNSCRTAQNSQRLHSAGTIKDTVASVGVLQCGATSVCRSGMVMASCQIL